MCEHLSSVPGTGKSVQQTVATIFLINRGRGLGLPFGSLLCYCRLHSHLLNLPLANMKRSRCLRPLMWLSHKRTSRARNDLLLPLCERFKSPVPRSLRVLKVQPHSLQGPLPCQVHPLGQHLSTQGKQLPFCSAVGAEQVKGIPQ